MRKLILLMIIGFIVLLVNKEKLKIVKSVLSAYLPQKGILDEVQEEYRTYYKITSKLNKKYQITGGIIGTKNNIGEKKVEGLNIIFEKKGTYTLDEARSKFIALLLDCLSEINKNNNLEKILLPYPFTHMNIHLIFGFKDHLAIGQEIEPYIGDIFFSKGKITFNIYKHWRSFDPLSYRYENFEEAYSKVKGKLPVYLQNVAEDSLRLSKERQKTEVEPDDYPNDESHPGRVATRQWIEKSEAPRDAKGYLIPNNPSQ